MSELFEFLPVSKEDMESRGWWWYDFLIVTGDAYVDHPSFGPTVIARVLEAEGYRVAILAQPDWHSADAFLAMGRPRLGAMLCSGNLDSMVALHRRQEAAQRGFLFPRQEGRSAAGSRRHCLRQPRTRGLSRAADSHRRA